MQVELTDTTETVARNTFLKRFLHPLRAMFLEAREEISFVLNCSSTAVVISTQHPFCQATGICLLLELKSPIHLPNLIITKKKYIKIIYINTILYFCSKAMHYCPWSLQGGKSGKRWVIRGLMNNDYFS